jgi:predicted nucleic acid-binding protein
LNFYIETSALIAALVIEPRSRTIRAWLVERATGTIFVSDWSHPEVASALSIKLRAGQITIEQRAAALAVWSQVRAANIHTLAVEPSHHEMATNFANLHELGVRAGDALDLAVAQAAGFTLITLDTTMAKAAPLLGVPVEALG